LIRTSDMTDKFPRFGRRKHSRFYDGTETTSRSLKEILPKLIHRIDQNASNRSSDVLQSWGDVVGHPLSTMSKARSFVDGVLTVHVANSTLLSLLKQHEKMKILESLRKRFPGVTIKTITFRIG